jgi:hypothetical protein
MSTAAHDHTGTSRAGNGTGDGAGRTAPHNLEAEQALLGAILVNNDSRACRPRLW